MHKFDLTTTNRQDEFLNQFLVRGTRGFIPEAIPAMRASFKKGVRPIPAGRRVTVYVTNLPELCRLNGLSFPVDDTRSSFNLAVPNFLAKRLELEPVGHELGLEVFGQELHLSAIPLVEGGFVICSTRADCQPCEDRDDQPYLLFSQYRGTAIRLEQKRFGQCVPYPLSHVARPEERMLLLYTKQGTEAELFGQGFRLMGT